MTGPGGTLPRHVVVRCRLRPAPGVAPAPDATVRVVVEDVTYADRAARVAGESAVPLSAVPRAGEVSCEADLRPGRSYAVRVHVDNSGDGRVAPGDLITTTHIPVHPDAGAVDVVVPLTLVEAPRQPGG